MDIKTAIEIADREIKITENCNTERLKELNSAWKVAKEALEKQIPKKPIIQNWCPALCPACGAELSEILGDGYAITENKEKREKPVCFMPNNGTYPLCVGKKNHFGQVFTTCQNCNLYEGMKEGEY